MKLKAKIMELLLQLPLKSSLKPDLLSKPAKNTSKE